MQSLVIIVGCTAAAICYGIVHDQITARLCVEYFTVAHPPLSVGGEPITSPTALAFAWGVVATWWVGLILGALLALAARAGARTKVNANTFVRPIGALLIVMGTAAVASGILGWLLATRGAIQLGGEFARRIPSDRHAFFFADAFAHNASYAFGILGGFVLIVKTYWKRRHLPR